MSGGSPGVLTLHPYPASPPRAYTYICMRKAPGSSPIWVGKPGAFIDYPLQRYQLRRCLRLCPL